MSNDYISVHVLRMHLGAEHSPVVIDVRGAEAYTAGHIPGAWHLPGGALAARLDEIPRGRPAVTY